MEKENSSDNPYAPSEVAAPLSSDPFVNKFSGNRNLDYSRLINGETRLAAGEIFREAWDFVSGTKALFFGTHFYLFLITAALYIPILVIMGIAGLLTPEAMQSAFWIALSHIINILVLPIGMGIAMMGIYRALGDELDFSMVNRWFSKLPVLVLLYYLPGFLSLIPVRFSFLFGMVVRIPIMFAPFLNLMGETIPGSIKFSLLAFRKHGFKIILIDLIMLLIMALSALPLLIGLIWTTPLYYIVDGVIFRKLYIRE